MKIVVINKQDLSMMAVYEADGPNRNLLGGPASWELTSEHIPCSVGWDAECVKGERQEDGSIILVQDEDLAAAKLARQWQTFRNLRDARLLKCDWTQLVDSPLNAQDKSAWAAYRQELRDLPENTEDPTAPVWPSEPGQG